MYIVDGICYASEKPDIVKVAKIQANENQVLILTFNNGEKRLFDATQLSGEAFKALEDEEIFKNVKLKNGVVTWLDGEIDCAPEFMYDHSYEYEYAV